MASSTHFLLNHIIGEIILTKPKSVLDIGVGYGKYGFLCRDYVEVHNDKVYPEQWEVNIEGIEIWQPYVDRLPWLSLFYNKIYVGDARKVIDELGKYDLIIAGDVIEHMPKDEGRILIEKCLERISKKMIISIPLRDWTKNKIVAGNPYESHISIWTAKDLIDIGYKILKKQIKTYSQKGIRGDHGVAVFER